MEHRNTGVFFQNSLNITDTFNILDYLYYYNGGGIAIGDLDNDGLDDLYFSANRGSNRLYRNKGNLQFEDLTAQAGVAGKGNWKTGVTLADINGDGLLDIYLCTVGGYKSLQGKNQLFINKGGMRFSEEAATYGLDVEGLNTQASFFDFDLDGDLDMFLVNHSVHTVESYGDSSMRSKANALAGDKLFRNDGPNTQPRFTEVTLAAGIYASALSYGLNVLTTDLTHDGWPDIYVSNDFHEHDYYYINQRNGTFREAGQQAFGHHSRFSMGSDAADINGDGIPELITLDMLPEEEKVLKASAGDDPLDIYQFKTQRGYHHQLARNCLQLNSGDGTHFRDIALYAGVAATDWSWSPLLADFDNDGVRDLFVSNGIPRRPNDLDFIKYVSSGSMQAALQKGRDADAEAIALMPEGAVPNRVFKGAESLRFSNQNEAWGFTQPSISNGAAYSDLDNDGDLDIVTNNLNAPATIYRNNTAQQTNNAYLKVRLQGGKGNIAGIGAAVTLWQKGRQQTASVMPTRGFQSASSSVLHFGLGNDLKIDSIQVNWPGGMRQVLRGVLANQLIVVREEEVRKGFASEAGGAVVFPFAFAVPIPSWQHQENEYFDFNHQQLIPHALSTQGPAMASADVDGNGLADVFVGGGPGQPDQLLLQAKEGSWRSFLPKCFPEDAASETVAALFFDANGDKWPDLYVVSGGNELPDTASVLRDRLYLNTGKGQFHKQTLPRQLGGNRSVVCAADIDRDGDQDLFVGSRAVAGAYGQAPLSHLLLNDGTGSFSIAAIAIARGLQQAGMITGAVFTDINSDGWPDLVVAGEWMPLTVFANHQGVLRNETEKYGLAGTTGLWQSLFADDLDGDGWPDLVAGNWGLNSKLRGSPQRPLQLYVGDVDGNGASDPLLALASGEVYVPFLGKEELEKALPAQIRKQYLDYTSMAGRSVQEIFGTKLQALRRLEAANLASVVVYNRKGRLEIRPLPAPAQWAPVLSFAAWDMDGDGRKDILAGGNFHGVLPFEGRYDAGGINLFLQRRPGEWETAPITGVNTFNETRAMQVVAGKGMTPLLFVASNNGFLQAFRFGHPLMTPYRH